MKIKVLTEFLALLICVCSLIASLSGQARVRGVISDSGGAVMQDVKVTFKHLGCVRSTDCESGGKETSTTSDGAGRYAITLEPGRYLVQGVSDVGFKPFVARVSLTAGREKKLDMVLHFAQPKFTIEDRKKWLEAQIHSQLSHSVKDCGSTSNLPKNEKRLEKTNRCVLKALAQHKAFLAEVGLMAVDSEETSILISNGDGVARHAYTSFHYFDYGATVASQQPLVWEDCLDGLQPSADDPHVLECKKPALH